MCISHCLANDEGWGRTVPRPGVVETKTIFHKRETSMSALEEFPRITPFLWFDNDADDAVNFYLSVFRASRRLELQSNSSGAPRPAAMQAMLKMQKNRHR